MFEQEKVGVCSESDRYAEESVGGPVEMPG